VCWDAVHTHMENITCMWCQNGYARGGIHVLHMVARAVVFTCFEWFIHNKVSVLNMLVHIVYFVLLPLL
jgi:hypothetical protein